MITWPISFAPFAEKKLTCQRSGALQVGAAVGAGVFPAHGAHLRQRFGDFQNAIGGQVAAGGGISEAGTGTGASAIVAWGAAVSRLGCGRSDSAWRERARARS